MVAYLEFEGALNGWLNGVEPEDFTWFDATRVLAANLVQRYAPTPEAEGEAEEIPADYIEAAAAAELFVGGWLLENRSRYTSLGGGGYSLSYTDLDAIKNLVDSTMPAKYLTGDLGGGGGEIVVWRGGPDAPALWGQM